MTDKEQLLEKYLLKIAENLDISPTMREKAEKSYRSVGKWLGDCDVDSDVKIMPQGSFYLGTVIRPVSDEDEYDIDLVCLLKYAIAKLKSRKLWVIGYENIKHMPPCSNLREGVVGLYAMKNFIWIYFLAFRTIVTILSRF